MKKYIWVSAVCLLMVASAQASMISNGDLNAAVTDNGSADGSSKYRMLDGVVQENGVDTAVLENQWVLGTQTRGWEYSATGGNGGGGAFVQMAGTFNAKARSVLQFANDGKATTGLVDISMDVFFDDNADGLFFNVELWGWNDGVTATGTVISTGGATANVASYNQTKLKDSVLLDNVQLLASDFTDAAWSTATVSSSLDLGTGYDFYAWRIGHVGASTGDEFAFDNITVAAIPEPATLGLVAAFGAGILFIRRKFMM